MSELVIKRLEIGAYAANAYFAYLPARDDMFVVDPGDDYGALTDAAKEIGRRLTHILLTHGHFDHIISAARLKSEFGAKICIHPLDAKYLSDKRYNLAPSLTREPYTPAEADILLPEGDFEACGVGFTVMHTPGHTPGGVCLRVKDDMRMFTGDTLFSDGFGRTDFEEGSWPDLYRSLKTLFALDPDMIALPGHGPEARVGDIRRRFYKK